MTSERRSRQRCPVCQGPTKTEADGSERCRNSMCAFNHQNEVCPRCKHKGPEILKFENAVYQYECPECMNRWSRAAS